MEHVTSTPQITRLCDIFRGYWKNSRITPAFFALFMIFFWSGTSLATGERQLYYNPGALETITAEDGSVWERVNEPGFGNAGNKGIVGLKPYLGSLYAVTRTTGLSLSFGMPHTTWIGFPERSCCKSRTHGPLG